MVIVGEKCPQQLTDISLPVCRPYRPILAPSIVPSMGLSSVQQISRFFQRCVVIFFTKFSFQSFQIES